MINISTKRLPFLESDVKRVDDVKCSRASPFLSVLSTKKGSTRQNRTLRVVGYIGGYFDGARSNCFPLTATSPAQRPHLLIEPSALYAC